VPNAVNAATPSGAPQGGAEPKGYEYVYSRREKHEKRGKREIGIHSVRGGTIVGEPTLIFAGNDEVVELRHVASSRDIFAEGAVRAAKFLASANKPGLYSMSDLL
jgi:4-hydroxy-tetrahydrodipicolinate reductase